MSGASALARRLEGLALVVLSGSCFATLGLFNRFAADRGVNVLTVLVLRFTLAALCLWLLALPGAKVRLRPRQVAGFLLLGALFVLEAGFFFVSSRRIPMALTALLLYLFPGLVMLLAWGLRGEHPGGRGLLALGLALAGIGLAVGFPAHRLDPLGVGLGLCSALGYAFYMFLGARFQEGVPPLRAAAWITTWAAALLLLVALATGGCHPSGALPAWGSILGVAVLGTVVPVFTLMAGLARLTATQASIAATVEPIGAGVLGALFLHESFHGLQWLGGGLVLVAVLLLSVGEDTAGTAN